MINIILNTISRIYNEDIENICTRILYFFNTINTYFILVGISSFVIVFPGKVNILVLVLSIAIVLVTARLADFYPIFLLFAIPVIVMLGIALNVPALIVVKLFVINIIFFCTIQFVFMGIPDSIVARDFRVPFIKMYSSLFTIAPTTVSFSISVFFSFYLSFYTTVAVSCNNLADYAWLSGSGIILFLGALITRIILPKNRFSKFHKPDITDKPLFNRVVILNIDGVRKDVFDSLNLPTIKRLEREGTYHPLGLETVYRALTNPAFASIFTGTIPKIHGVLDNNFGQSIKTEGLPDIVQSIAYGSMHVKHFCKKYWETRIVSLPRHSVYMSDDIMVEWLKEDLINRREVRLFIADFSEADFLAHSYGSKSNHYREALKKIDMRIGNLIDWMESEGINEDTAIIVCSDHGIAAIDHSYLIAKSERYVPFLIYGKGIRKGHKIERPGKIMDICCTVAYLLGIRYPHDARGQVFTEALENTDIEAEKEMFASRFNKIKYDSESEQYDGEHLEIYEGDKEWWDRCISENVMNGKKQPKVLDIGCGKGFVGERFVAASADIEKFVCVDTSADILEEAKKKLGRHQGYSFTTDLDEINDQFDIVAVSSVFHHVVNPKKLADTIDRLLVDDGIVIGSHEPNRRILNSKLFNAGASFYKFIGGGISIDSKVKNEFNRLLNMRYPGAPNVCREEILQMVEYHSPLEQYEKGVDLQSGFVPEEFFDSCFPGYEVLQYETYTTFFYRPWLSKHSGIQLLLAGMFRVLFKEGNLYRFVLKKS